MCQSYLISMQRGWRVRSFHCRAFLATGVQYALQFMKPDTPLHCMHNCNSIIAIVLATLHPFFYENSL